MKMRYNVKMEVRVGRKCTFAQTFETDETWGRKSCVLGCSVNM